MWIHDQTRLDQSSVMHRQRMHRQAALLGHNHTRRFSNHQFHQRKTFNRHGHDWTNNLSALVPAQSIIYRRKHTTNTNQHRRKDYTHPHLRKFSGRLRPLRQCSCVLRVLPATTPPHTIGLRALRTKWSLPHWSARTVSKTSRCYGAGQLLVLALHGLLQTRVEVCNCCYYWNHVPGYSFGLTNNKYCKNVH